MCVCACARVATVYRTRVVERARGACHLLDMDRHLLDVERIAHRMRKQGDANSDVPEKRKLVGHVALRAWRLARALSALGLRPSYNPPTVTVPGKPVTQPDAVKQPPIDAARRV